MNNKRLDGRCYDELRPIKYAFNVFGYADASILFELGNTKVLVSISLQPNVPPFLKGQRTGWLTAEYSMLPCATQQRTVREANQINRNSRNVEISRLIGRSLRTITNLEILGERTITIDCDVLQADGSTRTASITAASLALEQANNKWLNAGIIQESIFKEPIAAISAGIINGTPHLDLAYQEDSHADADFNFVMTKQGNIIEIQGTAEKIAVNWNEFELLKNFAQKGIYTVFDQIYKVTPQSATPNHQAPFFSLGNRINKKISP